MKKLSKTPFTLIELLVVTSQFCRDFFKRFICTDQYGCVRKHTESAALKNTPHHTCKASASCLPQANASCSNAALHTAEPCFIRSTFTLIELLVVIAIIAILAAMLLPALQQARERGKSAKCIGNMKSISFAIQNYSDSYNDFLPNDTGYTNEAAGITNYWQDAFVQLQLINTIIPDSARPIPTGIYDCPAEKYPRGLRNSAPTSVWNSYKGCAYGLNRYLTKSYDSSASAVTVHRKRSQIVKPSVTVSAGDKGLRQPIAETLNDTMSHSSIRARYYCVAERHLGSWNYSALDGSIKSRIGYPLKGKKSGDFKDWFWAPTDWTK